VPNTPDDPASAGAPPALDDEPVDAEKTVAPRRRRLLLAAAVVLGLTTVGLAVAAVLVGLRMHHLQTVADRRQAALTAARQEAVNFTSYDYNTLDRDFGRVIDNASGGFKDEFTQQSKQLRDLITKGQATSQGSVLDAAVVSAGPGSAVVLAVVDDKVKNVNIPDGATRHYRLRLALNRSGDRWLVTDLQFVL